MISARSRRGCHKHHRLPRLGSGDTLARLRGPAGGVSRDVPYLPELANGGVGDLGGHPPPLHNRIGHGHEMRRLGDGFRPGSKIGDARAFEIWALERNESVGEKIRCLLLFISQ